MKQMMVMSMVCGVTAACGPISNNNNNTRGDKAAVTLVYNHAHDQPGDDVGGAPPPVDVPLLWEGHVVDSGEALSGPGYSFSQSATWNGYATEPWSTSAIITNLNPGDWQLSLTVNGLTHACQSLIPLGGVNGLDTVTFQIDPDSGLFAGCDGN
jgi:hypothetical protein